MSIFTRICVCAYTPECARAQAKRHFSIWKFGSEIIREE